MVSEFHIETLSVVDITSADMDLGSKQKFRRAAWLLESSLTCLRATVNHAALAEKSAKFFSSTFLRNLAPQPHILLRNADKPFRGHLRPSRPTCTLFQPLTVLRI